jgi:disulfide bond formation protein DsbB
MCVIGINIALSLSVILKIDFGTFCFFNFCSILILVNHAITKPVISRYPVNWKHESTVVLNWKSDEMNFPLNLTVNVDLYYPKVGDLFGLSLAVLLLLVFLFFFYFLLLFFFHQHCSSYTMRNIVLF